MIRLDSVTKSFVARGRRWTVFDRLSFAVPSGRSVALLGENGVGKSTLLALISGLLAPDSGRVICTGSVSWPVGFGGGLHPEMSGAQNARFVARLYGVDTTGFEAWVHEFTELGPRFFNPLRTYSSGMRARLAFGLSMGIRFDTYLVDEVTAVGDRRFHRKCEEVFATRMHGAGAIVVSHQPNTIRALCDCAMVLRPEGLEWHDNVETALRITELSGVSR